MFGLTQGYPNTIKGLLWGKNFDGFHSVVGYKDRDKSTPGLDRFVENEASRYHIAYETIKNVARTNNLLKVDNINRKICRFFKVELLDKT